ncbi:hypothetical protein DL93DRAFT_1222661 [Clavulina sp. PMI_390]|nr:hypothetical protein DL93DRAFT_1222661 [Clavulina sp. PMI_390]
MSSGPPIAASAVNTLGPLPSGSWNKTLETIVLWSDVLTDAQAHEQYLLLQEPLWKNYTVSRKNWEHFLCLEQRCLPSLSRWPLSGPVTGLFSRLEDTISSHERNEYLGTAHSSIVNIIRGLCRLLNGIFSQYAVMFNDLDTAGDLMGTRHIGLQRTILGNLSRAAGSAQDDLMTLRLEASVSLSLLDQFLALCAPNTPVPPLPPGWIPRNPYRRSTSANYSESFGYTVALAQDYRNYHRQWAMLLKRSRRQPTGLLDAATTHIQWLCEKLKHIHTMGETTMPQASLPLPERLRCSRANMLHCLGVLVSPSFFLTNGPRRPFGFYTYHIFRSCLPSPWQPNGHIDRHVEYVGQMTLLLLVWQMQLNMQPSEDSLGQEEIEHLLLQCTDQLVNHDTPEDVPQALEDWLALLRTRSPPSPIPTAQPEDTRPTTRSTNPHITSHQVVPPVQPTLTVSASFSSLNQSLSQMVFAGPSSLRAQAKAAPHASSIPSLVDSTLFASTTSTASFPSNLTLAEPSLPPPISKRVLEPMHAVHPPSFQSPPSPRGLHREPVQLSRLFRSVEQSTSPRLEMLEAVYDKFDHDEKEESDLPVTALPDPNAPEPSGLPFLLLEDQSYGDKDHRGDCYIKSKNGSDDDHRDLYLAGTENRETSPPSDPPGGWVKRAWRSSLPLIIAGVLLIFALTYRRVIENEGKRS